MPDSYGLRQRGFDRSATAVEDTASAISETIDRDNGREAQPFSSGDLLAAYAASTCIATVALDVVANLRPVLGIAEFDTETGLDEDGEHVCSKIPLYMPGGLVLNADPANPNNNMADSTLHIADAILGPLYRVDPLGRPEYPELNSDYPGNSLLPNPTWMLLEYALHPEFVQTESWRSRAAINCVGVQGVTDCDEFPYYRTKEGGTTGPGIDAPARAHLRMITPSSNQAGGRDFGNFTTDCGLAHGDRFLIIPLPAVFVEIGVPSFRSC